jgi:hypothetical protein
VAMQGIELRLWVKGKNDFTFSEDVPDVDGIAGVLFKWAEFLAEFGEEGKKGWL